MFNQKGGNALKIIVCSVCVLLLLCVSVLPSFATATPEINWGENYPSYFDSLNWTFADSDTSKWFIISRVSSDLYRTQSTDTLITNISIPYVEKFNGVLFIRSNGLWAVQCDLYGDSILHATAYVTVFDLDGNCLANFTQSVGGDNEYVTLTGGASDFTYYWTGGSATLNVTDKSLYTFSTQYNYTKFLNALYIYSITDHEYLVRILEELEKMNNVQPDPEQTTRDISGDKDILDKEKDFRFNDEDLSAFDVNPFEDIDGNGVLFVQDLFETILTPVMSVVLVSLLGGLVVFALGRKIK